MTADVGFPPIARADARVLILGSLPGQVSLARQEYYAHPANAFWWIMGELAGAGPALAYAERCGRLRLHGVAVWDVCASASRPGSLDGNIVGASVVANDFRDFLAHHRHIELIAFNGATAHTLFRRLVLRSLLPKAAAIPRVPLLSTSPACTRPRAEKLARWRDAMAVLGQ